MPKLAERIAWAVISGVVYFVVVPAVMGWAAVKGLGTERRLRG